MAAREAGDRLLDDHEDAPSRLYGDRWQLASHVSGSVQEMPELG